MQITGEVRVQHPDPFGNGECDPLRAGGRDLDRMEVIESGGIPPGQARELASIGNGPAIGR